MDQMQLAWRKSTRCATGGCIEVATTPGRSLVRDSKDVGGPILTFENSSWSDFVAAVRTGEFRA